MTQDHIFVLYICEINVEKNNNNSEPQVDLYKLRKSKSVKLCPDLPYSYHFYFASKYKSLPRFQVFK